MLIDLSQLPQELRDKVDEMYKLDWELQRAKAVQEEKRLANFWHSNRPRSSDGIGEQVMVLHPFVDAAWRRARGPDCWADKDFKKWFLKNSPETRVRATGTKTMVGYISPSVPRTLVKKYA